MMRKAILAIVLLSLISGFIKFAKRGDLPDGNEKAINNKIISECSILGDVFSKEVQECEARIRAEHQ